MEKIKVTDLRKGFSIFGNRGNVFSNECHIQLDGEPRTLCGTPMLSSNWARIDDVKQCGCEECIEIYNELP